MLHKEWIELWGEKSSSAKGKNKNLVNRKPKETKETGQPKLTGEENGPAQGGITQLLKKHRFIHYYEIHRYKLIFINPCPIQNATINPIQLSIFHPSIH